MLVCKDYNKCMSLYVNNSGVQVAELQYNYMSVPVSKYMNTWAAWIKTSKIFKATMARWDKFKVCMIVFIVNNILLSVFFLCTKFCRTQRPLLWQRY